MASIRAPGDDQDSRGQPAHGEEDGMAEGDVDYLERQQEQGGFAEIRDHQGNIYMVSLEDLAAVGVDINRQLEISEEQMNTLLSMVAPMEDSISAGPIKPEYDESSASSDQLTISILLDGSIKLVTAGGHESYFSPSQLAEINIDTQNLTDDDIKRIVQLVGAATGETHHYEDVPDKRRKLENGTAAAGGGGGGMEERRGERTMQRGYGVGPSTASTSSAMQPGASAGPSSIPSRLSGSSNLSRGRVGSVHNGLIGESVKIQNAKGKIVPAVVRYSRPGMGYKVQTTDGKFEWIPPERIIDRAPRLQDQRDYDHKGYTSEAPSPMFSTAPSTSSGAPLLLSRRIYPPSTSSGVTVGGGGGGPLPSRSLPIRHLPPQPQHQSNFCCPVCDRKVYQKEPAYIVIRLPACDACTREKILIVDESTSSNGTAPARPQMRSIGIDTSDLQEEMEKEKNEEIPTTTSPEEEERPLEEKGKEDGERSKIIPEIEDTVAEKVTV